MNKDLSEKIYQAALSCGFDSCGIIPIDDMDAFHDILKESRKKVPAAGFFYALISGIGKTKKRFPWAKSVLICTYWYGKYSYPMQLRGHYAKDYFLKPEEGLDQGYDREEFESKLSALGLSFAGGADFSHISIGALRYAAVKAGLGIIRKNNFFYTEKGSYYRLIGYVIDSECELVHENNLKPCSEDCDLCRKACKTRALSEAYTMNPFKCVSFWNTFGRGFVPPYLKAEMFEAWISGCDNCQDACPYNKKHNWDEGESFSDIVQLAPELLPEKLAAHTDEYITRHIIAKTDNHLGPYDAAVIRRNAKRAIKNKKRNIT